MNDTENLAYISMLSEKAKKYDDLKSEVESIFFQDDEEIGLDVIGEKVCCMLGLYGNE